MTYSYKGLLLKDNRDLLISEQCKGKKVLHIGATDAPYTREKLAADLLLHKKLMEHSKSVFGIDIDKESIEYLKQQGMDNITYFDMNALAELSYQPDVIIFGEIIEHLQNLETALQNLKSIMTQETKLIISTPNQFYLLNFLITLLQKRECVHEDHKTGFTYGLLQQLLEANGLEINQFSFTFLPRESEAWYKKITRIICRISPGVSETLLATVQLKAPPKSAK